MILHKKNWANSVQSNHIELYLSHDINQFIGPILFIGGVHGDEPEGVSLAKNLLIYLNKNKFNKHWALIPCLNPDGFAANSRTNANNVDLNRNFPSKDWSKNYKAPRYYPGPHPASEPEILALTQLIKDIKPKLIIHFHSWRPSIILTGPPDNPEAKAFSQCSNYPLKLDIGYPTPGSLGQFAWFDLNIPVICIEEEEKICSTTSWNNFKAAFDIVLKIK